MVELKLKATATQAAEDFKSLEAMIQVLRYPLGVFINIGSDVTHSALVPEGVRGRVVAFAVELRDGKSHVVEERTRGT